jgi:hypothetical protein
VRESILVRSVAAYWASKVPEGTLTGGGIWTTELGEESCVGANSAGDDTIAAMSGAAVGCRVSRCTTGCVTFGGSDTGGDGVGGEASASNAICMAPAATKEFKSDER